MLTATESEVSISVTKSDIGTLYIVQHELIKEKKNEFAGVIVKHPLTNEIWMRVSSSAGDPVGRIAGASSAAAAEVGKLRKLFTDLLDPKQADR